MERQEAIDRIDLLGVAAAAKLCGHTEGGACERCTVSTVQRLWEAVDAVRGSDWPATVPTPDKIDGASL